MNKANIPLVSLIVSTYNGEKHILECLVSVANQTYEKFECIVVDDGSTDSTPQIIDKFCEKDERFVVLHKKNSGVSDSRNIGLTISKGEYVGILDHDDYLHPDYVKYLMSLILNNETRIATTNKVLSFSGNLPKIKELNYRDFSLWSGEKTAKQMLMYNIMICPWNKLISKELIYENNIKFQEQFFCGEGFAFSVECFQATDYVSVGHESVYFYRVDVASSGTSSFSLTKCRSALNAQEYIRSIIKDRSKYSWKILRFSKWKTASDFYTLLRIDKLSKKYPDEERKLKQEIRKNALVSFTIPVSFKNKVRAFLFWLSPVLAAKFFGMRANRKTGKKFNKSRKEESK